MSEDNENELMVRRAVFGKQVEEFMKTDVGRYIMERARDQQESALVKLKHCDSEDSKVVRMHQNEAVVADSIVQWLEDAVADGLQALNILEDRE